ncbi:kynurenine--oxoglutarate transaminase 1-like [Natator depressus]|uniref:kynurenine--oxoglutarate transaminase 1-like n=1 Tax=Natator depressus TaxID=27790 RepID=UPI003EBE35CF
MTLVVLSVPETFLVCSWYRGAEAGNATNWILSYAPSATPKFYGPAHMGRETVGPGCSLHITGLRGSYTLAVQGPGYNQAISLSVSFSVLVCVALLVTFIVCKRRRGSASLPGMWDRMITIGSAGKTFSTTGWKVGWSLGPDRLLKHLRTVHQNSVYHCPTAAQEAVAQAFQREFDNYGKQDSYFVQLAQELQQKRDWLVRSLVAVGMKPIVPEGTYFLMADVSEFSKFI